MVEGGRRRLSGTTWDVYLHILTAEKPQGVRDVWRGLSLSSPSLAQYHVNKLVELKLIELNEEGKYQANEVERLATLRSFVLLRGKLVPRFAFYGAVLLGILLVYILFWPFRWDFRDMVVLSACGFSVSAFFFEAYSQYRSLSDR